MRAFSNLLRMAAFVAAIFFSGSALAEKTFYYYEREHASQGAPRYSIQSGALCTSYMTNYLTDPFKQMTNCREAVYGTSHVLVISYKAGENAQTAGTVTDAAAGNRRTLICADNQTIGWPAGKSPSNDPPECISAELMCEALVGQKTWLRQTCVIQKCTGAVWTNSGGNAICPSPGTFSETIIPAPTPVSISGCEAIFRQEVMPDKPFPMESIGQASAALVCDHEYEYTGLPLEWTNESPSGPGATEPGGNPEGGLGAGDSGGDGDGDGDGDGGGDGDGDGTGGGGGDGDGDGDGDGSGAGYSTCAAGVPSCSGDALQCAQLKQFWQSTCEVHKALTEIKSETRTQAQNLLNQAKSDIDAQQQQGQSQVDGLLTSLYQKMAPTSGQCLPNKSVSVMGKSVDIPFEDACPFFQALRAVLMLITAVRAITIVMRAF